MTDDTAASTRRSPAERWVEAHRAELAGASLDDAVRVVEGGGLTVKIEQQGAATTMEFGIDRIRLTVDARGRVTEVRAG